MFNILNHQGNANQNNPDILPHTSQNGHYQKSQGTVNATEDVKKEEHSSIAVGTARW